LKPGPTIGRVTLWVAPHDAYAPYCREALAHSGLWHQIVDPEQGPDLDQTDVLALAGDGSLDAARSRAIRDWVEAGGRLVVSGGAWGLGELLGLEVESVRYPANETVRPTPGAERYWPPESLGARFFGGVYATSRDAQTLGSTASGFASMTQIQIGQGAAYWFGPHVGQTMALMQLGRGVLADGIGPNDGSARLADGILRAEDGIALSFDEDRNAAGGWFHQAHSDIVKEAWLRLLLRAIEGAGKRPLILWHWPRGADGAAAVSVDCESSEPEHVAALYRPMANYGVVAAWAVALPGFPLDTYRSMRRWEHEVALLYVPDRGLAADRFRSQCVALQRASGAPVLSSARMSDGGWSGLLDPYEVAEAAGCRLSIAKGGRQPGTTGFCFGTCHPFFPRRRDGSGFRVAELPYQLFEPGLVAPPESIEQVLREAWLRHGCAHLAIRSASARREPVVNGLVAFATLAKSLRLEPMTPERIVAFERARRAMRVAPWRDGRRFGIDLASHDGIEGLTVLIGGGVASIEAGGKRLPTRVQERYGLEFTAVSLDFSPKSQVQLAPCSDEAAAS
jgi:hypothetical protein